MGNGRDMFHWDDVLVNFPTHGDSIEDTPHRPILSSKV